MIIMSCSGLTRESTKRRRMVKKKVLIIWVVLVLAAFTAKAEVKTYQCGENCTATLDENGVMRVSGTGEMYGYNATTRLQTPWYEDRLSIKTLIVEDGITRVGTYALFNCDNIETVNLAKSVQAVNPGAFDSVPGVQSITMSDSTVWQNQEDFNSLKKAPNVTIHCRGVLSKCEENLMKNQSWIKSNVTTVAKLGKKIYTVEEATKLSNKINTIKIRYR